MKFVVAICLIFILSSCGPFVITPEILDELFPEGIGGNDGNGDGTGDGTGNGTGDGSGDGSGTDGGGETPVVITVDLRYGDKNIPDGFSSHDFGDIQKGMQVSQTFELTYTTNAEEPNVLVSMDSQYWKMTHEVGAGTISVTVSNKIDQTFPVGDYMGEVVIVIAGKRFSFAVTAFQSDTILPPSGDLFEEEIEPTDESNSFPSLIYFQNYLGGNGFGWTLTGGASILTNSLLELPYENEGIAKANYLLGDFSVGYYAVSLKSFQAIPSGARFSIGLDKKSGDPILFEIDEISSDWSELGLLVTYENIRAYKKLSDGTFVLLEKTPITITDHENFAFTAMELSVENSTALANNGIIVDKIAYYEAKFETENTLPTQELYVTPENITIAAGSETQLSFRVVPDNASKSLKWKSSDESIATVSDTGLVSSLTTENAVVTITATTLDGTKLSDTAIITIEGRNAPSVITVDGSTFNIVDSYEFDGSEVGFTPPSGVSIEDGYLVTTANITDKYEMTFAVDGVYDYISFKVKENYGETFFFSSAGWTYLFSKQNRGLQVTQTWNDGNANATDWSIENNVLKTLGIYNPGNGTGASFFLNENQKYTATNTNTPFGDSITFVMQEANSGNVGFAEFEYIAFYKKQ